MTLEEAIRELNCSVLFHEREADKCARHGGTWYEGKAKAHKVCAEENSQLAAWLEELKSYRETYGTADRPQGEWIPCEERFPMEEGNYLVTFGAFAETINGEKVIFGDIDGSVSEIGYGCYERDIFWHPTAFGWYDLATATPFDKRAIMAWMPLPEPWKGASDERMDR